MARCPTCNKFPALETEAEMDSDPEVSDDGHVTATVRLVRKCEEDGEEIKEYNLDLEGHVEAENDECENSDDGTHSWVYTGHEEPEVTDRNQTEDRHGKPIKNSRYAKRFIGATLKVDAECIHCDEVGTITLSDEAAAGWFEELV